MAVTKIRGGQLASSTVTNTQMNDVDVSKVTISADKSWNSKKITNLADPASAQDAATKNYVDSVVSGLDWKASCMYASGSNMTLSGVPGSIDGVSTGVAAGQRILLLNQTNKAEQGIWLIQTGVWTRPTDFDASGDVTTGAAVFVEYGNTYAKTGWTLTSTGTLNILTASGQTGKSDLVFTQFTGVGTYTAGSGITLSGTTISAKVDNSTIYTDGSGQLAFKADSQPYFFTINVKRNTTNNYDVLQGDANGFLLPEGTQVTGNTTKRLYLVDNNTPTPYRHALRWDIGATGQHNWYFPDWDGHFVVMEAMTRDVFAGNGSATAFTTTKSPGDTALVFLNGILQNSGAGNDYTYSGKVFTFASAPATGDVIVIWYAHNGA